MLTAETMWRQVRTCFEHDDGWFPTIALTELASDEVGSIYLCIRNGTRLVDPSVTFWDYEMGASIQLDAVPNAALLVSLRRAAAFAFAVEGIVETGIIVPNLGIEVFERVIAVHYKKGPEWGPEQVMVFFLWLKRLVGMTTAAKLDFSVDGPPDPVAFQKTWEDFIQVD